MQEITLKIHDITKGEEPPKDGVYLMVSNDPFGSTTLLPHYWHTDKKAWTVSEHTETLYEPCDYWGRLWAEDTFKEALK